MLESSASAEGYPNNDAIDLDSRFDPQTTEDVDQVNDQGTNKDISSNFDDDVDESQTSNQHRKDVELIEDDPNEIKSQPNSKPTTSFLATHNTKNRRRKKLRKT